MSTTDPNTVTSRHVSFRWDEQQKALLLTTQNEQIALTVDKVLELLELLYDHRDDIISASRALPMNTAPPLDKRIPLSQSCAINPS